MIINAVNGAKSDTYILQIITQQKLQKLKKIFLKRLDFKDIQFAVKARAIHKIKKNFIGISVFGYENKKNIQSMTVSYYHVTYELQSKSTRFEFTRF